jgi:phospholipase/carboxylesterase
MADTVEIETGNGDPVGSVIWLHGLGADGHDFEPIVPELALGDEAPLRFVFPHAPVRPVTINGGMSMRAWYDIVSLGLDDRADEAGILDSAARLEALVERERERGIPPERVVVAGFSQGGAIALYVALSSAARLAGLMALSTYLPMPGALTAAREPRHTDMPVFMAHGQFDPVVPVMAGRASRQVVESLGYAVEWHDYPMAHGVCPQEVLDIRRWLARIFHQPQDAGNRA